MVACEGLAAARNWGSGMLRDAYGGTSLKVEGESWRQELADLEWQRLKEARLVNNSQEGASHPV